MEQHYPNESDDYRKARLKLLEQEIALRRQIEAVAEARRALPPGGEIKEDYAFTGADGSGKIRKILLSELFGKNNSLAIYSYMFGPEVEKPCNMCTPLVQGFNSAYPHISQRMSLVAVAESPIERILELKKELGLDKIPILSSGGTRYNYDYYGKDRKSGHDDTMLNVFRRDGKTIRHFWGSELVNAPQDAGQDHRAGDLQNVLFMTLDLSPEGRGDWYPSLRY